VLIRFIEHEPTVPSASVMSMRQSGPRLGRPKPDPQLLAEEKKQFLDDQRQRNALEGKIGQGKRRYGLNLIREKLDTTQGPAIALNVLVMNLDKLLELPFVLLASWLQLVLARIAAFVSHAAVLNE